jgi:predicted ATPase/class 3 adenylate cyclase
MDVPGPAERMPSGTVTFLFTDIEGSTERWERNAPAMQDAVRRHDTILRESIESRGGYVFKTIGDAFCAVFSRAEDAVLAALDVQRRLSEEDFSAVDAIRVRLALHTGTADERSADYFGPTVNRVARLLASGHGGQVLFSGITADLVRDRLPDGVTFRDLGRHRLKDLAEAASIHQLAAPGLAHEFPPLRSIDARPSNLPYAVTTFVGRQEELAGTRRLFDETRLLTLVGTGGVGKTRLAVQLAADVSDTFVDGLWFVDLAPIGDPLFVAPAVLSTIGVREEPGRDATDTLVAQLREKRVLIVLDNCEHLVAGAAHLLDRLLRECSLVRAIATSREALEIPGEIVFRVSTFQEDDGAELFASRAKAAVPSFALTPENIGTVKRICKRLDGIALAIELAAARVKSMSIEELWKRLDDRFRILTGGSRTALPRQRTLRGLIEWSYNLLDEPEKILMRRLAIFAGTFSIDSAAAVCAFEPVEDFEVVDLLSRLVDKSLVQFESGDEPRYWLLESNKEFAAERLDEAGEREILQRRRAERLLSEAKAAFENRGTSSFEAYTTEMARDYSEYRAALQWALGDGGEVALGAALTRPLATFWYERGQAREGQYWLERVLEHGPAVIGNEDWAHATMGLSNQFQAQGEYALMEAAARRADEAYATLGDVVGQAMARNLLAAGAYFAGRFEEAAGMYESVATMARRSGSRRLECSALGNLAEVLTEWNCEYERSEELYARAVAIARDLGNSYLLGAGLGAWSQTAAYQGATERAESLATEALGVFRTLGDDHRILEQLIRLAQYRITAKRLDDATIPLREAAGMLRDVLHPREFAQFSEACADLAAATGDPRRAAELFGFSDAWRSGKNLARSKPLTERRASAAVAIAAAIGSGTMATALETGSAYTSDNALGAADALLRSPLR